MTARITTENMARYLVIAPVVALVDYLKNPEAFDELIDLLLSGAAS